ncbi:response regulator [Polaribacter sp.]|uniref:response regulator n=1 Tax=Polaribacter sp. TaxID=1920175 RepID=UPI0035C7E30B
MKHPQKNMLIVEDNPLIGEKILNASKRVLPFKNIRLTPTLHEAISYLKETDVDIVTLDLSLPDGNGIELLKWFKENNKLPKVYVFSTSRELKRTCLRYGAQDFFDKSSDFEKLINTISNTLPID